MARVDIESLGASLVVTTDGGPVFIDASEGQLTVASPRGMTHECGAFRPGIRRIHALVEDENGGLPLLIEQRRALAEACIAALRRAAQRRGMREPALERQIEKLSITALTFSEAFLHARHLREDVARFRAARVAFALVEPDESDDDTPEAAFALVERLYGWRELYLAGGSAKRAMNKTLTDLADHVSPEALFGLRRIALTRPVATAERLELLGRLGAHPAHAELVAHARLVERAHDGELARFFADTRVIDYGNGHVFDGAVSLLSRFDVDDDWTFTRFHREAVQALAFVLDDKEPTALPPIPLPDVPGIRFLGNVAAVRDEGARMRHCVASYAFDAVVGRAYLFHAATSEGHATVHLDVSGHVVQSFGPENTKNETSRFAAAVLETWGHALQIAHLGVERSTWSTWRAEAPDGAPLRRVQSVLDAYLAIVRRRPDRSGTLALFLRDHTLAALDGQAWLVARDVAGVPVVDVYGADGALVFTSEQVTGRVVTELPRGRLRRTAQGSPC